MSMPGFSAEASIYRSSTQYRTHARQPPTEEAATFEPATHYRMVGPGGAQRAHGVTAQQAGMGDVQLAQAPWRAPIGGSDYRLAGCPQECGPCRYYDHWEVEYPGCWRRCTLRDCDLYYRKCTGCTCNPGATCPNGTRCLPNAHGGGGTCPCGGFCTTSCAACGPSQVCVEAGSSVCADGSPFSCVTPCPL
jgi:hypothetical protein